MGGGGGEVSEVSEVSHRATIPSLDSPYLKCAFFPSTHETVTGLNAPGLSIKY